MSIKEFIEKAIEGGGLSRKGPFNIHKTLLDASAWKAVGKVEAENTVFKFRKPTQEDWALNMMHRMIDALAEGKTIEEYLATL